MGSNPIWGFKGSEKIEIVLLIETKSYQKVKDLLLKDNVVGRASITYKDAKIFGKEGSYYFYVSGSEEQCKKAIELTKDIAKKVKNKEMNDVIKKIKEEESQAMEGFGGIFG